jgi:hypothetical protein
MDTCDELIATLKQLPLPLVIELKAFVEQVLNCDQQTSTDLSKDREDMAAAIELGWPEFRNLKLRTDAARRLQEALLRYI